MVLQGAGGMKIYSADFLYRLGEYAKTHDIHLISDEIMTGFGKTGRNFASDILENKPDIICLSKALTAGMFPLSITSCSRAVFDGFLSEKVSNAFFHAHTFSAHPLGCAAAIAGIELLLSEEIQENISMIHQMHSNFASQLALNRKVIDARVQGVILAFELEIKMDRYGELRDKLYRFFMDRGIAIRPLGNTIYIVPPYVITKKQLERMYEVIELALEAF